MSRALGIPLEPLAAIRALKNSKIRRVDIGRCNDQYFCNNIAAGVIPKVVEEVTPKEKQLLGPLAYFVKGGQALFTTKDYSFHIQTDDHDFTIRSPLVIALLTNVVSSFEKFMPQASVDDAICASSSSKNISSWTYCVSYRSSCADRFTRRNM